MKKWILLLMVIMAFNACSTATKKATNKEKEEKYLIIKGMNKSEAGNYEKALKDFFAALKYNDENILTLKNIALTYSRLGNIEKGKEFFRKTLLIDENDYDSLYNLSVIHYKEKEYEDSLFYLNKIKIEHINNEVIKAKAYNYYKIKDYNKAYVQFGKIVVKNERYDISFYNAYIEVLIKTGRKEDVYPFAYDLYSKNKNDFKFIKLFSNYLKDVKAYKEAIEILKQYGLEENFTKDLSIEIAEVYYLMERYKEAERYMNLVSDKEKYSKDVIEMKIKICRKLGKKTEADDMNKVLKMINRGE